MFQDSLTKKIAEAASKIKTEYHEVEVNVNSVEGAGSKIMGEELKGNQHKIDANKNKKIDAHDFKMLRAQKDKEKANSQKFGKGVKEEVEELDEMDKSRPSAPRGAEGLPVGTKADPVKTDKVKSDALKVLQKQYKKVKEEVEHHIIKSTHEKDDETGKPLYWNNDEGWGHKKQATKFTSKEKQSYRHIPMNSQWEKNMKEETEEILEYKSKDGVYKHKGTYGTEKGVEYGETDFDKENELSKKHLSPKPAKKKYGARQNYVRSKRVNESFSDMISSYQEDGLKYIASLVKEEPDSEEFKKELEDQKSKMDGKKKGGDVAKSFVQAVKNEEYEIIDANEINGVKIDTVEERSLTEPEMKKKEEMVKGMKKGMEGFKQRYGDRAKEVMYATATARAKGE